VKRYSSEGLERGGRRELERKDSREGEGNSRGRRKEIQGGVKRYSRRR